MPRLAEARSWYEASAHPRPDLPPLAGDHRADVCVVGAGLSGLSAAIELAQRGYRVTVLEAGRIGSGASGRNGGHIVTGYTPSMAKIERWLGREDARRVWDMGEEAKRMIRERVERHRIDCDLRWGYFFAAPRRRHMAELRDYQAEWRSYGYDRTRMVETEELRSFVDSPAYVGGLHDDGGGQLHPLNYVLGLARAARDLGVSIFENSRVLRIEDGGRPTAHTGQGRVTADHLILAGNALFDRVPEIRRRMMPVSTYIIATEPLGEARAKALIPSDVAVADTNFVMDYFRLSSDHRLLFGGGVSYSGLDLPGLRRRMRTKMLRVFPGLTDVRIDFTWGGWLDISLNRMPHVGRLEGNVYYMQGFSGHGVALTGLFGRVTAEAIAGTAERFDVFDRVPKPVFPGGHLRTPALVLAMLYHRLRDRLW